MKTEVAKSLRVITSSTPTFEHVLLQLDEMTGFSLTVPHDRCRRHCSFHCTIIDRKEEEKENTKNEISFLKGPSKTHPESLF